MRRVLFTSIVETLEYLFHFQIAVKFMWPQLAFIKYDLFGFHICPKKIKDVHTPSVLV